MQKDLDDRFVLKYSNTYQRYYSVNTKTGESNWYIVQSIIPRGLKWIGNSCYLDSTLFALFAGHRKLGDFIDDLLYMNLDEPRKSAQRELKNIYKSITRTGKEVEYCSELRKALSKCNSKGEQYDKEGMAYSGKFIRYILTMLKPSNLIIIPIYTITEEKLLQSKRVGKKIILSSYIPKIIYTPYLIFDVQRMGQYYKGLENFADTKVFFEPMIYVGNTLFFLYSVVINTAALHYVTVAQYGDFWYYYDDYIYKKDQKAGMLRYNSFEEIVKSSIFDSKIVNPLTHGMQFYYKPN
jgi:ubiquitin C-terminal hydrolase